MQPAIAIQLPQQTQSTTSAATTSPTVQTPSRWKTLEFRLYFLLIAWLYGILIISTVDYSSESNPQYNLLLTKLSPGWMFGRRVDNSDHQYAGFRNNLPLLTLAMVGHLLAGNLIRRFSSSSLVNWQTFNLAFSFLFLLVMHGLGGLIKICSLLSISYYLVICKLFPKTQMAGRIMVISIWVLAISILFLNDMYRGYKFANIIPALAWLDKHNGIISRWYVTFNISILRMISFAMDYNWASNLHNETSQSDDGDTFELMAKKSKSESSVVMELSDKQRVKNSHSISDYNYFNYLSYCLYIPLYLAGPIQTFNSFISQVKQPPSIKTSEVIKYGLRLLSAILLMETMMHYFYVVAMSKLKIWKTMTNFQLMLFSYWNLKFIWLKLLIIWRYFRFWAMADGITCEENMHRCMSNNYSAMEFWQTWHRSYNRWLVRYLYIPLGGNKYKALNIFPVFTFVAVWHDIELRLLIWGWFIALFILPEIVLSTLARKYLGHLGVYYRMLCGMGAALNIYAMIVGNMIGFCDGGLESAFKFFQWNNLDMILLAYAGFFMGAQIMFEIRNSEKRAKQQSNNQ